MKACRCVVIAGLVFLCIGTAFAARVPQWVKGGVSTYPAEQYLTGVGLGSSLDLARANARAEIAKIFQTRIVQSAEETTRERSLRGADDAGTTAENSSALSTKTSTDDILQGTEITETYFDDRARVYYALAVLDKGKMRRALAGEVANLDETIAAQAALAEKAASVVDEIRALNRALQAWDRKDALLVKQRVVDSVPIADGGTPVSRARLQRAREEAAQRIVFALDNGAADGAGLNGIIGERITALGFSIAASTAAAGPAATVIAVQSRIGVEPVERSNPGWKFCNWHAAMEMRDLSHDGRVLAAVTRQGQASHISEAAARDKAVAEAAHALAVTVEQQVRQYLFGE
jgi:hypothetical protein